jgi:predicted dehydrogenase
MVGASQSLTDYHELLALQEIEAVLIALPIHLTAPITLDAAQAGKHVLLEKPLGANLDQGRWLKEQLAHLPVTVLVGENFRYRADLRRARELIQSGALGELIVLRLHSISKVNTTSPDDFASTPWRHDNQYRGGTILDAGVHHAAALRDLGGEVEWVQGFAKYGGSQLGGQTTLSMNLRFRSGAIGSYLYSVVCYDERPEYFLGLSVYGSEATLEFGREGMRLLRPGQAAETIDADASDGGYYGEFLNFHNAIREGEPVVATLEQSYKDMELMLRALDSAEEARVILL